MYRFILFINYLDEKNPKTCIWAARQFYNIIKRIQKKKIGQQKPETAGAEDNITKQSNWPSARSAIYVCFWLDDFLAEPK